MEPERRMPWGTLAWGMAVAGAWSVAVFWSRFDEISRSLNVELPWITGALMGLACRSRGPAGLVAWFAALGAISFLVRRWRATEARKALWALVVLACWTGLFAQAVGRPIFVLYEQLNRDEPGWSAPVRR